MLLLTKLTIQPYCSFKFTFSFALNLHAGTVDLKAPHQSGDNQYLPLTVCTHGYLQVQMWKVTVPSQLLYRYAFLFGKALMSDVSKACGISCVGKPRGAEITVWPLDHKERMKGTTCCCSTRVSVEPESIHCSSQYLGQLCLFQDISRVSRQVYWFWEFPNSPICCDSRIKNKSYIFPVLLRMFSSVWCVVLIEHILPKGGKAVHSQLRCNLYHFMFYTSTFWHIGFFGIRMAFLFFIMKKVTAAQTLKLKKYFRYLQNVKLSI